MAVQIIVGFMETNRKYYMSDIINYSGVFLIDRAALRVSFKLGKLLFSFFIITIISSLYWYLVVIFSINHDVRTDVTSYGHSSFE